jgi:hypothetical protein
LFLVEASCHWRIVVRIDLAALVLIAGAKLTKNSPPAGCVGLAGAHPGGWFGVANGVQAPAVTC